MRDDAARTAAGRSGGTCRIGRGAELATRRGHARLCAAGVPRSAGGSAGREGKGLDGSSALDTGWAAVHWAGERVSGRGACVWSRARGADGRGGDGAAGGRHDKCQASVNRSGALFGTAISTSLRTRGEISEPQLARLVVHRYPLLVVIPAKAGTVSLGSRFRGDDTGDSLRASDDWLIWLWS